MKKLLLIFLVLTVSAAWLANNYNNSMWLHCGLDGLSTKDQILITQYPFQFSGVDKSALRYWGIDNEQYLFIAKFKFSPLKKFPITTNKIVADAPLHRFDDNKKIGTLAIESIAPYGKEGYDYRLVSKVHTNNEVYLRIAFCNRTIHNLYLNKTKLLSLN